MKWDFAKKSEELITAFRDDSRVVVHHTVLIDVHVDMRKVQAVIGFGLSLFSDFCITSADISAWGKPPSYMRLVSLRTFIRLADGYGQGRHVVTEDIIGHKLDTRRTHSPIDFAVVEFDVEPKDYRRSIKMNIQTGMA